MLLSIGDIILAATLFVNAAAVLNFKVEQKALQSGGARGSLLRCVQAMQVFRSFILVWNLLVMLTIVL